MIKTCVLMCICIAGTIGFCADSHEISSLFLQYDKAKKLIDLLGDKEHCLPESIEKVVNGINISITGEKINVISSKEISKTIGKEAEPYLQLRLQLVLSLRTALFLKCKSLLDPEYIKNPVPPLIKYPSSVKIKEWSSSNEVDEESLKDPRVRELYEKALQAYETEKRKYDWNQALEKSMMIEKNKIMKFFFISSEKESLALMPVVLIQIHDPVMREDWLKEMAGLIRKK